MTTYVQGSLVMIGLNTTNPQVFWNGALVPNLKSIQVDWDDDDHRVKFKVSAIDPALSAELLIAGVNVRTVGAKHE
jgi:hypothetical protein